MNKLIQCFLDSDLRGQHDGLAKIAMSKNVNVWALKAGEHAVFINRNRDRVKMFSPGGVLSYLKLKKGKVSLETLRYIPDAFTGGDIEVAYSQALRKAIKGKLGDLA